MSAPMRPPAPGADRVCPACRAPVLAHDAFCTTCGTALTTAWQVPLAKGAPPEPEPPDDALEVTLEAAIGRATPRLSIAGAHLALATALLAKGRTTEAGRAATEGLAALTSDDAAAVAGELFAVRAWAELGSLHRNSSLTEAWDAVLARAGAESGLVPLAILAVTSASPDFVELPAKLVDELPPETPNGPPDRAVARFLLLAKLGRLREAGRAIGSGRGLAPQPAAVADEALARLVRSWLADHGPAAAAALHTLLVDALGEPPGDLPAQEDLTGAAGALWLPVLRVRARAAAAAGDREGAAADFMAAAQGEDYEQSLDLLRADLESVLELAPARADALYLSADFERVAAGEASQPADRELLARARSRWQAAADLAPPDQSNTWVLSALAAIVDAEDSPWMADVWEGVLALACRVLVEPAQDSYWLDLAGPLRQVRQYELARFANQRAADHGAPAEAVRTALLLESWVNGLAPDPAALAQLLTDSPNDVLGLFLRGSAALRDGELDPARATLLQVVTLEPSFLIGRTFLGLAQAIAGDPTAAATLRDVLAVLRQDGRDVSTAQEQTLTMLVAALVGPAQSAEELFISTQASSAASTTDPADLAGMGVLVAVAREDAALAGRRTDELLALLSQRPLPTSVPDLRVFLAALARLAPTCAALAERVAARLADFQVENQPVALPVVDQERARVLLTAVAENADSPDRAAASARILHAALLLRANQRQAARDQLAGMAQLALPGWVDACIAIAGTDSELDDAVERMCTHGGPGSGDLQRAVAAATRLSAADPGGLLAERVTRCAADAAGLWRARIALATGMASLAGAPEMSEAVIAPIDAELARRISAGLPTEQPPGVPVLVCELGEWLVPADAADEWPAWPMFTEVIPHMREQVMDQVGFRPPGVRVRPAPDLGRAQMRLMLHDDLSTAVAYEVPAVVGQLANIGNHEDRPQDTAAPSEHDRRALAEVGRRLADQVLAWSSQLATVDTVSEMLAPAWEAATGPGPATAMPAEPIGAARVTAAVRWALQHGQQVSVPGLTGVLDLVAAAPTLTAALALMGLEMPGDLPLSRQPATPASAIAARAVDLPITVTGDVPAIGHLLEALEVAGELAGMRARMRQLYGLECPPVDLRARSDSSPGLLDLSWGAAQEHVSVVPAAPGAELFTATLERLVAASPERLASQQAVTLALEWLARDCPALARVVGALWPPDQLCQLLAEQLRRDGTLGPGPIWAQAAADRATGWPELG